MISEASIPQVSPKLNSDGQLNRPFRALEYAGAASDAPVAIVEDRFARPPIRRPAADRTDLVTLPDAGAPVTVKADLQSPLHGELLYLFLQYLTPVHFYPLADSRWRMADS
jgi:hypothetical protein